MESSLKILDYLKKVSKVPITLDGEVILSRAPDQVTLSKSFFVKDDCVMCGKCCPAETTVWTQEGMDRIKQAKSPDFRKWQLDYSVLQELNSGIEIKVSSINGKDVQFFVYPRDSRSDMFMLSWPDRKESARCHWLFEKDGTYRCRIHPVRSVTCGLPHVRFFYNEKSNRTSIGVSQYGRNWALKCPVNFESEVDEQSVKSRILWLTRLNDTAFDCGIPTYLPEILEYLNSGGRCEKVFTAHSRKLFKVR